MAPHGRSGGTTTAGPGGGGGGSGGAPRSRWARCCSVCRSFTTFFFSHIGLCGLVLGYAILGAFTFEALESEYETLMREEMKRKRASFVASLWTLTADESHFLEERNWSARVHAALAHFERKVVHAVRKDGYDGNEESELSWSFSGALLYSLIVITTIGYGNIAPKTPWGKVVTIFYAIFGIPLMLLCLSNIGDAMAHSFKFLYWKICCILCIPPDKSRRRHRRRRKRRKRRKRSSERSRKKKRRRKYGHAADGDPLTPPGTPFGSPFPSSSGPLFGNRAGSALQQQQQLQMQLEESFSRGASRNAYLPTVMPVDPLDPSSTLPACYRMKYREEISRVALLPPFRRTTPTQTPIISNKYVVMSEAEDEPDEDDYYDGRREQLDDQETHQYQYRTHRKVHHQRHSPHHMLLMPMNDDDPLRADLNRRSATLPRSFVLNLPVPEYPANALEIDCSSTATESSESESSDDDDDDDDRQPKERNVPIAMCLLVVIGYICGGALLFTAWESWSFLDSSYFCFVTLTTIGFGDYVPGTAVLQDEEGQKKLVTCALYLLFGMALLAMSFNLVQEEVTKSVREIGKRMGLLSDDD